MAYISLVPEDFYQTPYLGNLPSEAGVLSTYNVKEKLVELGIANIDRISEVFVYVFFTGFDAKNIKPVQRAVYEIFTQGDGKDARYSQFMNATFNQRDTVINSANMWFPFTPNGQLFARIPAKWSSSEGKLCADCKHAYKNLGEAMEAYVKNDDNTLFMDLFLTGYRLKN